MKFKHIIPAIISSVILSAHFLRSTHMAEVFLCLISPFLLLIKRNWAVRIFQFLLLVGSLIWVKTTVELLGIRMSMGMPWVRMTLILTAVTAFTIFSACILKTNKNRTKNNDNYSTAAFVLSA